MRPMDSKLPESQPPSTTPDALDPPTETKADPATQTGRRDAIFEEHRGHLLGLGYRLLGSWSEAEDLVQETYLRWFRQPEGSITTPRAWLTTVLTRLGVDELRSARHRREEYVGPWLPEPVATEVGVLPGWAASKGSGDAADERLATGEALSLAFLRLLEALSPAERAAFLLRQVFDYDYGEVASILERSEASCRQLVHRAKGRVAAGRPRFQASPESQQTLLERFLLATASGELEPLVDLLAEDAILYSDGGGKAAAALNPIYGADRIARFMLGVAGKQPEDLQVEPRWVNHQPAAVGWSQGAPTFVLTLEVVDGRIAAVQMIRNPDKMTRLPHP